MRIRAACGTGSAGVMPGLSGVRQAGRVAGVWCRRVPGVGGAGWAGMAGRRIGRHVLDAGACTWIPGDSGSAGADPSPSIPVSGAGRPQPNSTCTRHAIDPRAQLALVIPLWSNNDPSSAPWGLMDPSASLDTPEPEADVEAMLTKLATRKSTRSVRMYRMVLVRAIRRAQVNDLAMRNVAELISVATGQPRRPSKALTLEQALALLEASKDSPSVGLRGCQPSQWPAYRGSTSPQLVRS